MQPLTFLLGGSALFLALTAGVLTTAGTAIFSLRPSRIRTLVEEGFAGAPSLARLHAREGLQPALALVATLCGLGAVGLFVAAAALAAGTVGSLLALPVAIAVLLLFVEILPAGLAARHPVRVALASAPVLVPVEGAIRALLRPWSLLSDWAAGRNGEDPEHPDERAVRDMAVLGREEGVVDVEEHLLVERAFRLDELAAWDVMTPRVDMFAWSDTLTLADIVDQLPSVPYSRVPVFNGSIDDITGVLYVREAYATYVSGHRDLPLKRLSREPFFVPGSLSLAQLLRAFQMRRIHMGIVADEFGGTDGLVTLEDVLEELVGEIVDETDIAEEPIIRISRTELMADAGVDLREINYAFNTSLPQLEHRSLNGFILEELGRVPGVGESFARHGLEIEVLEATETQVLRARLRKVPDPGQEEGEEEPVERNA